MPPIQDHPLRYTLSNELHARPFPRLSTPGQAAFLAIKRPRDAAKRDRDADRAHLLALLDRFGADHPKPNATHYFADLGPFRLKWESHTEFVTYTAFVEGAAARAFDPAIWEVFPDEWLTDAPGSRITSAHIHIVPLPETEEAVLSTLKPWFVPESLALSYALDRAALVAGDFRIDSAGHVRFAVFAAPQTGPQRVGRIVQRLCEIETYKSMSMLGFARVHDIGPRMGAMDERLSGLVSDMGEEISRPEDTLAKLLAIGGGLEQLQTETAFRFAATRAYAAIVDQRIAVLREERFQGRQSFAEFMMRRFDPAMRTVAATETRLKNLGDRAIRASDLLRTRVDVDRSAQNQDLMERMDRRAALQLRLQKTVEGLSVVAISYYAVNLVLYLLGPLAEPAGISKTMLAALAVLPVVGLVWLVVRRIRRAMED